jgi:hypothetical protein
VVPWRACSLATSGGATLRGIEAIQDPTSSHEGRESADSISSESALAYVAIAGGRWDSTSFNS